MKAVIWKDRKTVGVEDVADPEIREPTDAIVRVTTAAICGSDLHLYNVLTPQMRRGDVLGHEAMGVVEATGPDVTGIAPGDRVVVPFTISCGTCWMCERGLTSQCETTQRQTAEGKGGMLFGYTDMYGGVPGGQAELLRVPQAQYGPIKVPEGYPDERFMFLSDILPTAWQGVRYADVREGSTVAVIGLGPVGQFCCRVAKYLGARTVIGVDTVPERLALARRWGVDVIDTDRLEEAAEGVRERTDGRGADAVIEAVGMEAHGSPMRDWLQERADMLPESSSEVTESVGVDRLDALATAFASVRRGGTVSILGVYVGEADPLPLADLFDKGLTIRMGQCNVKHWIDEIWPALVDESDPLGTEDLASHRLPLDEAARGYAMFDQKEDGCIKVLLKP